MLRFSILSLFFMLNHHRTVIPVCFWVKVLIWVRVGVYFGGVGGVRVTADLWLRLGLELGIIIILPISRRLRFISKDEQLQHSDSQDTQMLLYVCRAEEETGVSHF